MTLIKIPEDTDYAAWDHFLPTVLIGPNASSAGWRKGEVWVSCSESPHVGHKRNRAVYRVVEETKDGLAKLRVLAADGGWFTPEYHKLGDVIEARPDSYIGFTSRRLFRADERVYYRPQAPAPVTPAQVVEAARQLAAEGPLTKAPTELPRWLRVVNKILVKSVAHKKAGRTQFTQVFVPIEDYRALVEQVGQYPEVFTAIGPVTVWPVNPDGATFSDGSE